MLVRFAQEFPAAFSLTESAPNVEVRNIEKLLLSFLWSEAEFTLRRLFSSIPMFQASLPSRACTYYKHPKGRA